MSSFYSTTMATKQTATKERKTRNKIDLSTAQVIDGALRAPRSIREVIGQVSSKYATNDIRVYRQELEAMPLHRIQEHAYQLGVAPAMNKKHTIARLEEAFLKEFSHNGLHPATSVQKNPDEMTVRERAEAIMRRQRIG